MSETTRIRCIWHASRTQTQHSVILHVSAGGGRLYSAPLRLQTQDMVSALNDLEHKAGTTQTNLLTTINKFTLLSSSQFFENRVYEDRDVAEANRSGDQEEADNAPPAINSLAAMREAVTKGMEALKARLLTTRVL